MPGSAGPLIATATGSSDPLVFTCSAGQGLSSLVGLWWSVKQVSNNATLPGSITDTQGGTWVVVDTGFDPTIGTAQIGAGITNLQTAMAVRHGVNPLGAGDTITLNWDAAVGAPTDSCVIVQGVLDVSGVKGQSIGGGPPAGVVYFNGQGKASGGAFPEDTSFMLWSDDEGFDERPAPAADAAVIGSFASIGGGTLSPVNGSRIASLTSGDMTLSATLYGFTASGGIMEPGGTFTGSGSLVVGNYQFIGATGPAPPPGPSPKATCTRCGSGLMGLSYRTTGP